MRFNLSLLYHSKVCRVIILLAITFFSVEYLTAKKIKKQNPIIKGVKTVSSSSDPIGNNSFVYYHTKFLEYPIIKNEHFGITVNGAVLSPHYSKCIENDNYMDFSINIFNEELPNTWSYLDKVTIKNTTYMGVKTNGLYISKDVFRRQGSNRHYIPTNDDLERFENSGASKEGFVYIGEGWFYLANGYDVKKALKKASTMKTKHASFSSHVYIGNPLLTIAIELIKFIFNSYQEKKTTVNSSPHRVLFDYCKAGDIRVRFRIFNSPEISTVAFRVNNTLKPGKLGDKRYSRIVGGSVSPNEVMRPSSRLNDSLFLPRLGVLILVSIMINIVSANTKEHSMNVLLFACIVYAIRAFIWNTRILNPAIGVSILIVFLTIYVAV
jgi:hypothetical protein